jgi:hypothetical protein
MRLNVRLIGVLAGLMLVALAGRFLLEVAGRSRGGGGRGAGGVLAALLLAGATLWLLGYIGVFFGRLIKAAVSRQREFLADASAVQFTRNPDGIGGALRKIGGLSQTDGLGTRIAHPQAEKLSHLFLGAARPIFVRGLYATHPPLAERIRRIYGRALELVPAPENQLALAMAGGAHPTAAETHPPIARAPGVAFPTALSPVAGLVAEGAAAAERVTEAIGTVNPPKAVDFALNDAHPAVRAVLREAASEATQGDCRGARRRGRAGGR